MIIEATWRTKNTSRFVMIILKEKEWMALLN